MATTLTNAQITEFLHLAFLQVAQTRLDQARYVVKGGATLRYFFGSPRYSEDLDLDAVEIEPWKLQEKVDEILASPALRILLRSGGLALKEVSAPKQTATTQRWKMWVATSGRPGGVRTKMEFSHRRADPRRVLEAVSERVVAAYALRPPSMQHYTGEAAIEQKLGALAHRAEPQARDLFDLELLLRRHPQAFDSRKVDPRLLEDAVYRVYELPYQAFQDQVRPFLEQDAVEPYSDGAAWERAQTYVAERLMELR